VNVTEQSLLKILKNMKTKEERAEFLQAYIQQIGPLTEETGALARKILSGEEVEL